MAAMVTAQGESGWLYTHQTENVCADPPSKPASQDMLAHFTPGETDREVAAWGLVPVMEGKEELMEIGQHFNFLILLKFRGSRLMYYIYLSEADWRYSHLTSDGYNGG